MNLLEILKNVPEGTTLYSPAFGEVIFKCIYGDKIMVEDVTSIQRLFYSNGNFYKDGECMLFPSREDRDWNNFYICPFKKGDFITKESLNGNKFIAIFSHFGGPYEYTTNYLCLLRPDGKFKPESDFGIGNIQEARLATDSEKKELLDVIDRNGYYWDECSLTLKKLKFNINSLKPFDKVLVRYSDDHTWTCNLFSHYTDNNIYYKYRCLETGYIQCVPYNDETKHLVGTKKDCPEYYKTW